MTTEEAGRLATGLVGAAAAEREEAPLRPPAPKPLEWWERTYASAVNVHLKSDAVSLTASHDHGDGSGWATIGPVHLHGEWDVLEATLVAALDAVRTARQGPVGA